MLKDIRILDLADEQGSFCSKLLADLGAFVIKGEPPAGDPARQRQPSLSFTYHNTNKHGITLDLTHESRKKGFLNLIKDADVLVETFAPGYLEGLNLNYAALSQENPGLIHLSITGFGQTGPRRTYRSNDLIAAAYGGQMYVTGDPSSPPLQPYGEQAYYAASLFGAVGILLALRRRSHTGKGIYIDLSVQEAVVATLDHVMVRYFSDKTVATRTGNRSWNNDLCVLPCKDGFLQMTLLSSWDTLVEWMAAKGMAGDLQEAKWQKGEYRAKHIDHIIEVVQKWTGQHTTQELFETAQAMRLPWAPICSPAEVITSPHLAVRRFFIPLDHFTYPGMPYRFSSYSPPPIRQAPALGEHNEQITAGHVWPKGGGSPKSHHLKDNPVSDIADSAVLAGIRVVDFTRILSGPYATRILADFGAEVIKIQSHKTANGAELNSTAYFATWNRNKHSITLDMSHPEARDIALKLIAVSDVVVENFSPRVLPNWGLGYDHLRTVKPDIIMIGISAMGQTGPWRDFAGLAPTFHALSGLTALTSQSLDYPVGIGHAYGDTIISLYAVIAILTALKHRDETGEGQYIDLSGYEALCTVLGPALMEAGLGHAADSSEGADVPCGYFRCLGEDRWCVITVSSTQEWEAFCRSAGHFDWIMDERFSTKSRRRQNRAELDCLISQWTARHAPEEIVQLLQTAGVPAGVVQNAADLAHDPQLMARSFFIEMEHLALGTTVSDRSPLRFTDEGPPDWKAAPLLGEDNRYVFIDLLGHTEDEVSAYIKKGVIA
ncbi:MAG: CoA transferase [Deltaproteobacteria bacterium]|nr:CoA transferase [Deltaproteobacteria bacterium]